MRGFRRGDVVEVCDDAEILAGLDENEKLDGLTFSPEMLRYCGKRFKVSKHLSNIMVEGVGVKTIEGAVILEGVKCHGEFHEGCSRACSLIWKEKWLRRIEDHFFQARVANRMQMSGDDKRDFQNRLSTCQAVSLANAALRPGKSVVRTYLYDLLSSELKVSEFTSQMSNLMLSKTQGVLHRKRRLVGTLTRTPSVSLGLQPGEIVEVKSIREILETLDRKGRNRGLYFTPEMLKYCNLRYPVLKRVNNLLDEATGRMRNLANTVVLDGATCDGRAHGDCPRACNCLWREAWLKRVSDC